MPATLMDIGSEWRAFNELCEELPGGELSPEAEAAFAEWAKTLADDEAYKLENYCRFIRTLEGEIAVAKSEAEEYAKRAKTRENRVTWLKRKMLDYLTMTGRTKVQTATGRTVAIQANGGKLPLTLAETDPLKLPTAYQRVKVEIDNEAIRSVLEGGGELPFAKLEPRGNHLRIR